MGYRPRISDASHNMLENLRERIEYHDEQGEDMGRYKGLRGEPTDANIIEEALELLLDRGVVVNE